MAHRVRPVQGNKKAGLAAGFFDLDITATGRYERTASTVMPAAVRLLMGITSFTLLGVVVSESAGSDSQPWSYPTMPPIRRQPTV